MRSHTETETQQRQIIICNNNTQRINCNWGSCPTAAEAATTIIQQLRHRRRAEDKTQKQFETKQNAKTKPT